MKIIRILARSVEVAIPILFLLYLLLFWQAMVLPYDNADEILSVIREEQDTAVAAVKVKAEIELMLNVVRINNDTTLIAAFGMAMVLITRFVPRPIASGNPNASGKTSAREARS